MSRATLALVLAGTVLATSPMAAANLLDRNPGFETGTTNAWSLGGDCTLAVDALSYAGEFGGLVTNRSRPWDGPARLLSQELDLVGGTTYAVSIWVRHEGPAPARLTLVAKQTDDVGTRYHYLDIRSVAPGEWTRLAGDFIYSPSGELDKLLLYVGTVAGEGNDSLAFLVDEARVIVPGDADGDADVDLTDLGLLLAAYGQCDDDQAYPPACDFDEDGCITLTDLGLLLSHYGEG